MRQPKLSLFCFIDALGWRLVERYGFLNEFLTHRQRLDTILGYSCTCDPTILTGLPASQHGHFSFYYYNPKDSPFKWMPLLDVLPKSITNRGRVRHWISRLLKKVFGFTGYFQIYTMPFTLMPYFDYSERRDIYAPGGINSGAPTIFAEWEKANVSYALSPWWNGECDNLAWLKQEFSARQPRACYLYLAAMDAILHQYGNAAIQVEQKIRWYEDQLRLLVAEAEKHYQEVRLFVFSDHGMTDVTSLSSLRKQVESLPLQFGRDYAAVFDSTMARFWFLNDEARRQITDLLVTQKNGRILSDQELRDYGCYFPDGKYGQLFFLLDPGVLLCPSHLGEAPLKGMHGYAPEDPDSWASLLSNVDPQISMQGLADLFQLMKVDAQR